MNLRTFGLMVLCTLATGCGKYGPPRAPEALAPAAVQTLEVTADVNSVAFKWKASETNASGEELKSMDEYRVYRKELSKASDLLNEDVPYVLLSSIQDTHVDKLKELREESLKANKPTRKVRVDDALLQFEFTDRDVRPGQLYAYRIVPVNQGGVEGVVSKIAKVLYRGDTSEIALIDESELVEDEEVPFE